MKAVVYSEYGPPEVLKVKEVAKPVPKDNEILVKVKAVSVGYGDLMVRDFTTFFPRKFNMPLVLGLLTWLEFGLRKPKKTILGTEFSGEVEATGKSVTRFKAGDQVFGYLASAFGANAEYLSMPEDGRVDLKPSTMTHAEASTVPFGAMTALNLLKKVNLQRGQKILINGASGGIGSSAVQIAKHHYGAEVTGVCGTPRLETVLALGADKVIDYTREDFTRNGETYDVVFDILGKSDFSQVKGSLTQNGRYLRASFKVKQLLQMLWTSLAGSKKVICAMSFENNEDLAAVKELCEAGKLKAIVGRTFPLEQTAEAHRHAESGQATGKVVVTVGASSAA